MAEEIPGIAGVAGVVPEGGVGRFAVPGTGGLLGSRRAFDSDRCWSDCEFKLPAAAPFPWPVSEARLPPVLVVVAPAGLADAAPGTGMLEVAFAADRCSRDCWFSCAAEVAPLVWLVVVASLVATAGLAVVPLAVRAAPGTGMLEVALAAARCSSER